MPKKIVTGSRQMCVEDRRYSKKGYQRGVSLVELMVGIAIGLMVVAVAGGVLMVSRGLTGTVSDVSQIQQQAAYALRAIGQQVRQSGSLYLNLNPENETNTDIDRYAIPVAFETRAGKGNLGFDPKTDSIQGTATTLNVGYSRYAETLFFKENASDPDAQSQSRDCLGGPSDAAANLIYRRLQSNFSFNATGGSNDLVCTGTAIPAQTQPIVTNVANFQIRYLLQGKSGSDAGSTTIRYANTGDSGFSWAKVTGVEVCIVFYGNERMDLLTGDISSYTDCDGTTRVDMSSAASTDMNGVAIGTARAGRLHMVFRNTYQLRSQGLIGSVL